MGSEKNDDERKKKEQEEWWRKRAYGFSPRDFEMDFSKIEKMIEEMMKHSIEDLGHQPLVFGISLKSDPQGIPKVSEFGNARDYFVRDKEQREWTPLTDVQETEDKVLVTVDVPGVEKEDIDLQVTDRELVIKVEGARKYHTRIKLPTEVEVDNADAKYRNGVLEVKLKRKYESKGARIEVK